MLTPPPMDYSIPAPMQDNTRTISYEAAKSLFDTNKANEASEVQEAVHIGNRIENLSSRGANTYPIFIGSKKVGSVVKCDAQKGWEAKAMFVSAEEAPMLFDTDDHGNVFPNISEIQQYFIDKSKEDGKKRKITMITTGPTFESYGSTQLTGIDYDNGEKVGSERSLNDLKTSGKAIIYITGGKIHISHTQEMTQDILDTLIAKDADIMTMSSMKRNGNTNPNASLRSHEHGHALVQFSDGTRGEVILNNCSPEEKQQVMNGLSVNGKRIVRAVYADADAKTCYLDGIRVQTKDGVKYSHPDNGDLFMNEYTKSGEVVKGNMPGIIVYYAIKQ